jgi:Chaperone of endosialidase
MATSWEIKGNTGTNPAIDFIGTIDNSALAVRTDNKEALRVDVEGNVGIGTTSPGSKLEIDAPDQVGLVVKGPVTGVGAGAQLTTTGTGGRGWEILATGQASAQGQDKLNIRDLGNGTDVFTITSDGNVGIGTTNPGFQLEVDAPNEFGLFVGGPVAGVGAGATLSTRGLGSVSWTILATGQTASQGAGKLNVSAGTFTGIIPPPPPKDVFTITSEGEVGIGTTSPGFQLEIDAPNQLGVHVAGPNTGVGAGISLATIDAGTNVNSWEILATGDSAAQGQNILNIRHLSSSRGLPNQDILTIGTFSIAGLLEPQELVGIGTTTPQHKLEVNGDVAATSFVTISTREMKDNILDLCSQEAIVALEQLSPVKFQYKSEHSEKTHIGFIAEDVPELVATTDRKAVSVMDIVALVTQVVKE